MNVGLAKLSAFPAVLPCGCPRNRCARRWASPTIKVPACGNRCQGGNSRWPDRRVARAEHPDARGLAATAEAPSAVSRLGILAGSRVTRANQRQCAG